MKALRRIASIRSGYPFRRGLDSVAGGRYGVVQIKDITQDGRISFDDLARVNLADVRDEQFVRRGDVLFVSRGVKKQAVAVESEPENTIAPYQFFMIVPHASVTPEYLAWYINQKPARRYIEEKSVGSNVRIISKEVLYDMPVAVPPFETQHKIVQISRLGMKEKELLEAIQDKRSQLVEAALLKSIQPESNE